MTHPASSLTQKEILSSSVWEFHDNSVKEIFKSLLRTKRGLKLVRAILATNPRKIAFMESEFSGLLPLNISGLLPLNISNFFSRLLSSLPDHLIMINPKPSYTLIRSGRKNFLDGTKIPSEVTCAHELQHLLHANLIGSKELEKLRRVKPKNPDMDDAVEEVAISTGEFAENKFRADKGLPLRYSHKGSYFPPVKTTKKQDAQRRLEAFIAYLNTGSEYDALKICTTLPKKEILNVIVMFSNSLPFVDQCKNYFPMVKLIVLIAKKRNLTLSPQVCLQLCRAISSPEQLKWLEKHASFDIRTKDENGCNILFYLKSFPYPLIQYIQSQGISPTPVRNLFGEKVNFYDLLNQEQLIQLNLTSIPLPMYIRDRLQGTYRNVLYYFTMFILLMITFICTISDPEVEIFRYRRLR